MADAELEAALGALLEGPSEAVREQAERLLQGLDRLHRPALVKLANLLDHHGLLEAAAADLEVAALLDLYDLLPLSDRQRAERALEDVRAYIHSHGGQLELLGVEAGTVRVRLDGSCSGCSGSAITLKRGVEAALREGFDGFTGLLVEEAAAVPAARPVFVPLGSLTRAVAPAKPVFLDAAATAEVVGMKLVVLEGTEVLLHNLGGEIYAFRRGGERESFPVAIEGGRVKVAVNVPAAAPLPG